MSRCCEAWRVARVSGGQICQSYRSNEKAFHTRRVARLARARICQTPIDHARKSSPYPKVVPTSDEIGIVGAAVNADHAVQA